MTTHLTTKAAEHDWRDRPFQPIAFASFLLGCSVAHVYALEKRGELRFRRVAGKTQVLTEDVIALLDAAEPWTPSNRGRAAREARVAA